jgi:hypothetical protein
MPTSTTTIVSGSQVRLRAGIPEVDLVQTIEAIAYVKFSRRDWHFRQQDRERADQQEIWAG